MNIEKVLKTKKEEINEVIEASQEAHEQREEAKHKTIMLRSRAEKDLQQYDTDIKEEERSAENDFQLKEFMEVKNQEREERSEKISGLRAPWLGYMKQSPQHIFSGKPIRIKLELNDVKWNNLFQRAKYPGLEFVK